MNSQEYSSVADDIFSDVSSDVLDFDMTEREFREHAPERFEVGEISDFFNDSYHDCFPAALASEVHEFVRVFAHPYRRCFDSPAKSPKNEEIESAIKNKGKKGCCTFHRDTGTFVVRPLTEWMFFGNNLRRSHYYTSGSYLALPYHDVDCHLSYQTQADATAARQLIEEVAVKHLGVAPHFLRSYRGENGYLKVDLTGIAPAEANRIFDEYQEAMRLFFAKHQLMADFEIKGTVTYFHRDGSFHAGRYGKLPMCSPGWDYRWHRSLVKAPTVTPSQIESFAKWMKSQVSDADVARHRDAKHRLFVAHYLPVGDRQKWLLIGKMGLLMFEECLVGYRGQSWIARDRLDADTIEKLWPNYSCETTAEASPAMESGENLPDVKPTNSLPRMSQNDIVDEPDSFVRQRKALLKLSQLLKRLPTVDEGLKFIQTNGLYTGTWANPARRRRVRGILKFIAKTFDPTKCSKFGKSPIKVNIGKYDDWAKKKFPKGLGCGKRKTLTDNFEICEVTTSGHVDWNFISVFLSVCESLLIEEKNPDGSLPHERAMKFWKWLHNQGLVQVAFDDRKWAVCRDKLEKLGIVKVTDRTKAPGQAWKWSVGTFFPFLGLWKAKKEPSLREAVSWDEFNQNEFITRERQHNSLLQKRSSEMTVFTDFDPARPPPVTDTG